MRALVVMLLLLVPVIGLSADAPAPLDDPHTALLIIDVQDFYFPGGALPLVAPGAASAAAGRLLAAFRDAGRTVVHVGHEVAAGGGFHVDVAPRDGELVVMKTEVNAFHGTDLLAELRARDVTRLVICGMQTHMCLEGAARAAHDHGFAVVVVGDACATRDLERDGTTVPAAAVHAATLATLDRVYGEVVTADAFLDGR